MQLISKLSDMIEEELNDAEKYIECAMENRMVNTELAETFYKLSVEEMNHVAMLHTQVAAIIAAYRKENGAPPEKMQFLYDYLHKKHIDHANKIKVMQGVYKL